MATNHERISNQSEIYSSRTQQTPSSIYKYYSSSSNPQSINPYISEHLYAVPPTKIPSNQHEQPAYNTFRPMNDHKMQSSQASNRGPLPIIYHSENKSRQSDSSRKIIQQKKEGGSRVVYDIQKPKSPVIIQEPIQHTDLGPKFVEPKSEEPEVHKNSEQYIYKTKIIRAEQGNNLEQNENREDYQYEKSMGTREGNKIKIYSQITNQPIYIDANQIVKPKNNEKVDNVYAHEGVYSQTKTNHQIKQSYPPNYPPRQSPMLSPTFNKIPNQIFPQSVQSPNRPTEKQPAFNQQQPSSSRIQMLSTQTVPRIQYERCVNQCKNWETKYNELYLKFMNLAASYEQLAAEKDATISRQSNRQVYFLQQENENLSRELIAARSQNKKIYELIQIAFSGMVQKQQQASIKQTQLLIERYKLENRKNSRFQR